jgi:hypothetical protein
MGAPSPGAGYESAVSVYLDLVVAPQPDIVSCGPTCLHGVYNFFGEEVDLTTIIEEAPSLEGGGTLAVLLGSHALERGYNATLYSLNLDLLDPSWFKQDDVDLAAKLEAQADLKHDSKLSVASSAYASFLRAGGAVKLLDLSVGLVRSYLERGLPLLAGTSATYLYRCARELPDGKSDDLRGKPQGHFVVVTGLREDEVRVSDPWQRTPEAPTATYWVPVNRFIQAVLLGVLTYDGNLLVIEPKG